MRAPAGETGLPGAAWAQAGASPGGVSPGTWPVGWEAWVGDVLLCPQADSGHCGREPQEEAVGGPQQPSPSQGGRRHDQGRGCPGTARDARGWGCWSSTGQLCQVRQPQCLHEGPQLLLQHRVPFPLLLPVPDPPLPPQVGAGSRRGWTCGGAGSGLTFLFLPHSDSHSDSESSYSGNECQPVGRRNPPPKGRGGRGAHMDRGRGRAQRGKR